MVSIKENFPYLVILSWGLHHRCASANFVVLKFLTLWGHLLCWLMLVFTILRPTEKRPKLKVHGAWCFGNLARNIVHIGNCSVCWLDLADSKSCFQNHAFVRLLSRDQSPRWHCQARLFVRHWNHSTDPWESSRAANLQLCGPTFCKACAHFRDKNHSECLFCVCAIRICAKRNRPLPQNLVVLGDNTVRELKNQHNLKYLAQLLSRRKMRLCALHFLRKSHTHDLIDQVWGVLSRRISRTDSLLTASDVVDTLQQELERPGVRSWIGATTEVHVEKLNCVRNWKDNWRSLGISLEGGLKLDSTANHVFVLMNRKGWGWGVWKLQGILQLSPPDFLPTCVCVCVYTLVHGFCKLLIVTRCVKESREPKAQDLN